MEKQKLDLINDIRDRRKQKKLKQTRRKILSIITMTAVTMSSFGFAYTASAKEITLTEINEFTGQNDTRIIKTHTDSVEKILEDHGVTINETDKINIPLESAVTDDTDIVVTRGKQITVKTKDGEQIVSVTKADAKDALVEAGYNVDEKDEIKADGDTIELIEVEETEIKETEPVAFETEYIDDPELIEGETKVISEGVDGVKTKTYTVTVKDGAEISRELISEEITTEPENKVIAKGSKTPQNPGTTVGQASSTSPGIDTGSTIAGYKYTKKITMRATAYSTHPSENGGYTVSAMGNPLGHGIVAVDPSIIPLGSKVYIEAADGSWVYGVASAEDTGGAIKGNKIDLCYEGSVSEVNTFGIRDCVVYILE